MPRRIGDGHVLAYSVTAEMFNSQQLADIGTPALYVNAGPADGGSGVLWEFTVTEHRHGTRKLIKLGIFDDAFAAFRDVPEFFAALDAMPAMSIDDVVVILRRLGAVDRTVREAPPSLRRWTQPRDRSVTG
jgi:hypothetical protein